MNTKTFYVVIDDDARILGIGTSEDGAINDAIDARPQSEPLQLDDCHCRQITKRLYDAVLDHGLYANNGLGVEWQVIPGTEGPTALLTTTDDPDAKR